MMKFGSVCSGIEAASVASDPLGWEAAWFSEIEPFPCAVLEHHHPEVPNHGDMTLLPARIRSGVVEAPDVLVGGTPCQAFSVAGHRKGLDDARGNLTLIFCDIADAIDERRMRNGDQPSIIFWENVPGVLSDKTNAFGCFLGEIVGESDQLLPPGGKWANAGVVVGPQRTAAWRILDAQYFGVAQRRRRVFVVASAREDFDPVSVLLEFGGVRRDSAPSRGEGKGVAGTAEGGACGAGPIAFAQNTRDELRYVGGDGSIAGALAAQPGMKQTTYALVAPDVGAGVESAGGWAAPDGGDTVGTLMARDYKGIGNQDLEDGRGLAIYENHPSDSRVTGPAIGTDCYNGSITGDVACTMGTPGSSVNASGPTVMQQMQVRRLTPVECERLQGFPDDYTNIPWRGKFRCLECNEVFVDKYANGVGGLAAAECPKCGGEDDIVAECPDGPRYKALGNSWAVPCVRWIFERIDKEVKGEAQNAV